MYKISNLEMNEEIVFNNQVYVLNQIDFGKADISLFTYQGNNQVGVNITGRSMGARDLSIVGYILGNSESDMLDKKRFLLRIASPFEDFYIIKGDYKIRVAAGSNIEYGVKWKENNQWLCKFKIDMTAANPCFILLNSEETPISFWNGNFHFPLHMRQAEPVIMGVKEVSLLKMIENNGEVETGMKIRMTASLVVENPYILNMITLERLDINYTMQAGDVIEVNTNYGQKSIMLNGQDAFLYFDLDSEFIQLHIGENYLRFGAESNEDSLDINVSYDNQYLEA